MRNESGITIADPVTPPPPPVNHTLQFMRDRCIIGMGMRLNLKDCYAAYLEWCAAHGATPISIQRLTREMHAIAPEITTRRSSKNVRFHDGINLLPVA